MTLVACGNVNADGTTKFAEGCAVANGGGGSYTLTLPRALPDADMVLVATLQSTGVVEINSFSDTVKRVFTRNLAGALTNTPFAFLLWRKEQ